MKKFNETEAYVKMCAIEKVFQEITDDYNCIANTKFEIICSNENSYKIIERLLDCEKYYNTVVKILENPKYHTLNELQNNIEYYSKAIKNIVTELGL